MFIVAALFAGIVVFGLIVRSIPLPPILHFDRDEQPIAYWAATAFNSVIALMAFYIAIVSP
jgi:hypothetical protein